MSQTQPYTYGTLINQVQLQTLNDPSGAAVGTQEYQTYAQLIATFAIPTWENERGVLWNELWVEENNYATIVANQPDIALPPDFKFLYGGNVRLTYPGSTASSPIVRAFPVKKLEELELNPRQNMGEWYVYGNIQTGFYLRCGWIPQVGAAEIGATVSFRYYSYATTLQLGATSTSPIQNPNDVPQMSDPTFIVDKVSALVSANNFNMQLYQIQEDKANYKLGQMVMANNMAANYMDDYIKDIDGLTGESYRGLSKMNSGYWTNGAYGPN